MPVPPVPVYLSGSIAVSSFSFSVFIKTFLKAVPMAPMTRFLTDEDKMNLKTRISIQAVLHLRHAPKTPGEKSDSISLTRLNEMRKEAGNQDPGGGR